MNSPSRDHARTTCAATPKSAAPTVQCDLCESPFRLPPEIAAQGRIYGLLVCTQCIEDQLQTETRQ
jgi:hypothetical protein